MPGTQLSEQALIAAKYFLKQYILTLTTELHNLPSINSTEEKDLYVRKKRESISALTEGFEEFYLTLHKYHFSKWAEKSAIESEIQKLKLLNNSYYTLQVHLELIREKDPKFYHIINNIRKRAEEIILNLGVIIVPSSKIDDPRHILSATAKNKSAEQQPETLQREIILYFACALLFITIQYVVTHRISINKNYFILFALSAVAFSLLTKTAMYSISRLMFMKGEKQIFKAKSFLILPLVLGTMLYWFYLCVTSSYTNAVQEDEFGTACSGYITSKDESLLLKDKTYKLNYYFIDGFGQRKDGTIIVDKFVYATHNVNDRIGIFYQPENPESWKVYLSDGKRPHHKIFPSGDFDSTSFLKLGNFLSDTTGILSYLQTIDFGFFGPYTMNDTTYVYLNENRLQRVEITPNQNIEVVSLFLSSYFSPLPHGKRIQNPDSSFGHYQIERDGFIYTATSLHENIIPFDHYRIYHTDSIYSPTFIPKIYEPSPEAKRYFELQ